jgi:hypothetical protein
MEQEVASGLTRREAASLYVALTAIKLPGGKIPFTVQFFGQHHYYIQLKTPTGIAIIAYHRESEEPYHIPTIEEFQKEHDVRMHP